jgi:hypothetical protein
VRRYDGERFHATVDHRPVRAGLVGLLFFILLHVVAMAAFLTRWGLGLVAALACCGTLLGFLGWLLVAVHVGRFLARSRGWKVGPFWYGLVGLAIACVAFLIPVVGQIAAVLAALVGVGALLAPAKPEEIPAAAPPPSAGPPPA